MSTDQSVAAIGAAVGWPDPSQFSRRFRAEFGVSPRGVPPARGRSCTAVRGERVRGGGPRLLTEGNFAQEHVNPRQAGAAAGRTSWRAAGRTPSRPAWRTSGIRRAPMAGGEPWPPQPPAWVRSACSRRSWSRRARAASAARHRSARRPPASAPAESAPASAAASPSEANAEPVTLTYFVDDNNVTAGAAPGPDRRLHGARTRT